MIVIGGKFPLKPECREAAMELVRRVSVETLKEEGNLQYDFYTHIDDANLLHVFEEWVDQEALDAHLKTPYLQEFFSRLPEMLSGPMDAKAYQVAVANKL